MITKKLHKNYIFMAFLNSSLASFVVISALISVRQHFSPCISSPFKIIYSVSVFLISITSSASVQFSRWMHSVPVFQSYNSIISFINILRFIYSVLDFQLWVSPLNVCIEWTLKIVNLQLIVLPDLWNTKKSNQKFRNIQL